MINELQKRREVNFKTLKLVKLWSWSACIYRKKIMKNAHLLKNQPVNVN